LGRCHIASGRRRCGGGRLRRRRFCSVSAIPSEADESPLKSKAFRRRPSYWRENKTEAQINF